MGRFLWTRSWGRRVKSTALDRWVATKWPDHRQKENSIWISFCVGTNKQMDVFTGKQSGQIRQRPVQTGRRGWNVIKDAMTCQWVEAEESVFIQPPDVTGIQSGRKWTGTGISDLWNEKRRCVSKKLKSSVMNGVRSKLNMTPLCDSCDISG